MELDNIEKLLEKYFEGTSSIQEEQTLRSYFESGSVASHLEQYVPMFQYFSKAKKEKYSKEVVPLTSKITLFYKWAGVAAVAVLAFGIFFGNNYRKQQLEDHQKALMAYNETKKAFALLAENFNKGAEKMAYLKEFETTKQKIYNND